MTESGLLVPVAESASLRNTVTYAVEHALDHADEDGSSASIHFVYPLPERVSYVDRSGRTDAAESLLDRVASWAEEDAGDADLTVETALIATHVYLSTPGDYADVLVRYAEREGLDRAMFDPRYDPIGSTPLLPSLEAEVRRAGLDVDEAPVSAEQQQSQLVRSGTLTQFFTLFAASFLFYLVLAGSLKAFELATGAISAGIVAVSLWRVSLTSSVDPLRTVKRLARFVLYVPFLLWEIAKANFQIAYIVLHPALPIQPKTVEFDAAVWSSLPVTTLANSITLTPGTLTVDVERSHLVVHSLTASAREDLFAGTLERAVRFVFYGRAAARIPSPIERRESEEGEE
ncbi:monovalent cation/H+ antiporter subunit E [Halolamina salifodinae]|uniref:Multicomponent Na+:H+ antiporter subunit E n=1 Tax=Halolamina salifodinae TaxID=1202767 RepID=A0A8T4GXZ7_9EURY|nr:monovalent cation/H+ antiporter subunit E [Halolamina salifodinae]MBP1987907.1 multicomponent Na+:H+ antiporter subunit E [Halolamina salifodinae]